MEFPKKCPKCSSVFWESIKYVDGRSPEMVILVCRTDLKFSWEDTFHIEDQVFECSHCHTLFRAKYELLSLKQLEEK